MNGEDIKFFGELLNLRITKEMYDNYIKSNIRNTYEWVTKDGQHIKLSLIKDSHLTNIIKMVEKKQKEYAKLLRILKLEKSYREHYNETVKLIKEYVSDCYPTRIGYVEFRNDRFHHAEIYSRWYVKPSKLKPETIKALGLENLTWEDEPVEI